MFFVLFIILYYTKATDADLLDEEIIDQNTIKATTLDFANKDTANAFSKTQFFNVTQMIPNGFAVESLRIQNEGEMDFNYKMRFEKTGGDDAFCSSLDMIMLENWSKKYDGDLNNFVWESEVKQNSVNDLVFSVSFESEDASLFSKSCQFNIVIDSRAIPSSDGGFFDQEILDNSITSRN